MTALRFLRLKAYYSPLASSAFGSKSSKRDLTLLISRAKVIARLQKMCRKAVPK